METICSSSSQQQHVFNLWTQVWVHLGMFGSSGIFPASSLRMKPKTRLTKPGRGSQTRLKGPASEKVSAQSPDKYFPPVERK